MRSKLLHIGLLCLCLNRAIAHSQTLPSFDYQSSLGIFTHDDERNFCVSVAQPNLPKGANVYLIGTTPPQPVMSAKIVGKAKEPCGTGAQSPMPGLIDYTVRVYGPFQKVDKGIAVVNPCNPVALNLDYASGDIDGDGRNEYFISPAAEDSFCVAVYSGYPAKGTLRWKRCEHGESPAVGDSTLRAEPQE